MLSIENVTIKNPEGVILLKQVSISILSGSLLYVMGANGQGKTSLLRVIAGLKSYHSGQITFNKQDIAKFEGQNLFSYIGHNLAIKPELKVQEMLMFWAQLLNGNSALAASIFYLQLENLLPVYCAKLSQGEQKKLALARLMLAQSPMWLLDEVASNLDQENSRLLFNLIQSKVAAGGIVLLTSHTKPDNPKIPILNLADFY